MLDFLANEALEFVNEFTIHDGMINSLGKFEGETILAPYFYHMSLHGCGDIYYHHDVDRYELFNVDAFDIEALSTIVDISLLSDEEFPLAVGDVVAISEDSQGFVYAEINPQF